MAQPLAVALHALLLCTRCAEQMFAQVRFASFSA